MSLLQKHNQCVMQNMQINMKLLIPAVYAIKTVRMYKNFNTIFITLFVLHLDVLSYINSPLGIANLYSYTIQLPEYFCVLLLPSVE